MKRLAEASRFSVTAHRNQLKQLFVYAPQGGRNQKEADLGGIYHA